MAKSAPSKTTKDQQKSTTPKETDTNSKSSESKFGKYLKNKPLVIVSAVAIFAVIFVFGLFILFLQLFAFSADKSTKNACTVKGKTYAVGTSFKAEDGCNTCSCTKEGVECTKINCVEYFTRKLTQNCSNERLDVNVKIPQDWSCESVTPVQNSVNGWMEMEGLGLKVMVSNLDMEIECVTNKSCDTSLFYTLNASNFIEYRYNNQFGVIYSLLKQPANSNVETPYLTANLDYNSTKKDLTLEQRNYLKAIFSTIGSYEDTTEKVDD